MFTIKINGIYIHCVSIIFLLVLACFLVNAVDLFVSPTSADFFVVVDLSSCCTLHSICQALAGQIAVTTVTTFCFTGTLICAHSCTSICICILVPVLILSKSFVSLNLLKVANCTFVAPLFLPMLIVGHSSHSHFPQFL